MSRSGDDRELPLSETQFGPLNTRQRDIYCEKLAQFGEYLRTEADTPTSGDGYAEGTVKERIHRFHRAIKWLWSHEQPTTEITTDDADKINEALTDDTLGQLDGGEYAEGSKRKINDVLRNWFDFQGTDWNPEHTFSDNSPQRSNRPDVFTKNELKELSEAALTYKTIPSYNNLSPEERDRWRAHLAQELGKPKEEVRPDDWEEINNSWKIPSLIRTTRGHGWRPALVGKLKIDWYDPDEQSVFIPAGKAPKNDASWRVDLTDEEAFTLERWLEQRKLKEKYDKRNLIWLNRKGNPYDSGSLNDLLGNLIEEAGIETRGRKLVWYSFRHSIGTYVYAEYTDLEIVAEQLRQKSRSAASKYVHPVPELKREAASIM